MIVYGNACSTLEQLRFWFKNRPVCSGNVQLQSRGSFGGSKCFEPGNWYPQHLGSCPKLSLSPGAVSRLLRAPSILALKGQGNWRAHVGAMGPTDFFSTMRSERLLVFKKRSWSGFEDSCLLREYGAMLGEWVRQCNSDLFSHAIVK